MRLTPIFKAALAAASLAIAACGSGAGDTTAKLAETLSTANGGATVASQVRAAAATTASPNGTTIPSAAQIVDSTGNLWTVSGGVISENGKLAGYSAGVTLLVYANSTVSQENAAGGWWSWNGTTWVSTSQPVAVAGSCGTTNGTAVTTKPLANLCSAGNSSTVAGTGPWTWSCAGSTGGTTSSCSASLAAPAVVTSPNGTTIPSATQIVDAGGNVWTLSGGVVYEKGALAGYSKGVTLLLYQNNTIYQENTAGGWWSWSGSTWVGTTQPVTAATTPTISGNPATADLAGSAYSFLPTTTNPGGGTLAFSITYMPAWASFNKVTGALTGTPSSSQVGTYSDILVSVTNGVATASLAPFSINVTTGSASLGWTAPTKNTDGTALTNLAGYTIHYGTSAGALTQTVQLAIPGATSYVVSNLSAGVYYFAVSAYSAAGTQSANSSVSSKSIM
jgi:hypothetical protein